MGSPQVHYTFTKCFLSVNYLSLIHFMAVGHLDHIPGMLCTRQEYTLDGMQGTESIFSFFSVFSLASLSVSMILGGGS